MFEAFFNFNKEIKKIIKTAFLSYNLVQFWGKVVITLLEHVQQPVNKLVNHTTLARRFPLKISAPVVDETFGLSIQPLPTSLDFLCTYNKI